MTQQRAVGTGKWGRRAYSILAHLAQAGPRSKRQLVARYKPASDDAFEGVLRRLRERGYIVSRRTPRATWSATAAGRKYLTQALVMLALLLGAPALAAQSAPCTTTTARIGDTTRVITTCVTPVRVDTRVDTVVRVDTVRVPVTAPVPTPTPTPVPVPVPPSVTHEPTGMTRLVDHDWSALAPLSGRNVNLTRFPGYGTFLFPRGYTGSGSAPGVVGVGLGNTARTLYVRQVIAYGDTFYGHASGINKMSYMIGSGWRPWIYTFARGGGTGTLTHELMLQGMAEPVTVGNNSGRTIGLPANRTAPAVIVRGRDHVYEYVITINTPGQRDGSVRAWQDGALTHEYTGLVFSATAATWEEYQWAPVWGGVSTQTMPTDTWQRMDHLYLSAR